LRAWIAPVFLPHAGCPHRCVFCDQGRMGGGPSIPSVEDVRDRLARFFETGTRGFEASTRQIAFYGGSFTMLEPSLQESYLAVAAAYVRKGWVDSIRVSTRPDALGADQLSLLRRWGVATIEIGVQSLSDSVLEQTRRGHKAQDSIEAIKRAKEAGFEVGAQIMLGLPGDRGRESLQTAERLCSLRPDFVRLYPVVVFEGTELASRLRSGQYRPLGLEEAVCLAARMLDAIDSSGIPVVRIGLLHARGPGPSSEGVLAGPVHPAFGYLVRCRLYSERLARALSSGGSGKGEVLRLRVHPRDRCLVYGHKGTNLAFLTEVSGARRIEVQSDEMVPKGRALHEWIGA